MLRAMTPAGDVQILLCTVPDAETGRRIAARLVEYRLAACVNLLPGVQSVYRWQGKVQSDEELLLIIKARVADYARLEAAILELHPYELPEILAVPLTGGLPRYLDWVRNPDEAK
jgi:periplasmic divalent cation tolerance protein